MPCGSKAPCPEPHLIPMTRWELASCLFACSCLEVSLDPSSTCHRNRGCPSDFSKSPGSPLFLISGGSDAPHVYSQKSHHNKGALPHPLSICYTLLSPWGLFSPVPLSSGNSLSSLTQRSTVATVRISRLSMTAAKEKRQSQKPAVPAVPPIIPWVFPGQISAFFF